MATMRVDGRSAGRRFGAPALAAGLFEARAHRAASTSSPQAAASRPGARALFSSFSSLFPAWLAPPRKHRSVSWNREPRYRKSMISGPGPAFRGKHSFPGTRILRILRSSNARSFRFSRFKLAAMMILIEPCAPSSLQTLACSLLHATDSPLSYPLGPQDR
jgi:hypothetical protein